MDIFNTFLFFRFLNFFLIVGFLVYAVTKYVISYIKEKITSENKEKNELLERQINLEKNDKELARHIAHEKIIYEQIHNKITAWRAIVEEKRRKYAQKKETNCRELYAIHQKQRQSLINYTSYTAAAKEVMLLFEKKTKHEFNEEMVSDQFTRYAITQLLNKK